MVHESRLSDGTVFFFAVCILVTTTEVAFCGGFRLSDGAVVLGLFFYAVMYFCDNHNNKNISLL